MNQAEILEQLDQLIAETKVDKGGVVEGVTCRALCQAMGLSRGRVGEKLRDLVDAGKIKVMKGKEISPITGFAVRTYFYSPVSAEKGSVS